ncbi:hypothetical protein [Baekduia alba]|uniref:hypothetical protein n=1 Tax=Baekduia alba TaxID=2997333 RepID=UPI00234008C5|nr:hypothetical protein [Baekduia alba]
MITAVSLAAVSAASGQPRPVPGDVGPLVAGGGFVIQSCGETGSAEGWSETTNNNPTALASGVDCPPSRLVPGGAANEFQQAGLWISDRLGDVGGTDAAPGDRAELSFSPLAGTVVSRVRWWRSVYKQLEDHWQPYTAVGASNAIIDSCDFAAGHHVCGVGGTDWYPNDGNFGNDVLAYTDLQNLSTNKVIAGVYCRPNPDNVCIGGATVTYAEVMIFSAFLTIADPTAPSIGTPTGDGWTTAGWSQGTLPLAVASNDLTGIAATRVYADGSLVATLQRGCSYTRPRPCTDEPTGAVGLPTAGLADGAHTIVLSVEDAAGNTTTVQRGAPLLVDNAAPAPPVSLASPRAAADVNSFSATWSLPADAGSPIDQAQYQVCQDGICGATQVAASLTGLGDITLPHAGAATLRVWLRDALGHADPATAATIPLAYTPPPTVDPPPACACVPTPPITPPPGMTPPPPPAIKKSSPTLKLTTLRRVGRKISVGGSVSSKASGKVTIRYRARIHGRTHTLTKRVAIRRRAFRTTLTLTPGYAAQRAATVTISYAGDADTTPQSRTAKVRTRA